MTRVTGIGGIFFNAKDPASLREWYRVHLGIDVLDWGGAVFFANANDQTIWSIFPDSSDSFSPSQAQFMINYRVQDLASLLALLKEEGCEVDTRTESSEFGKFGWVMDPEGNRIELWQPPDEC